MVFASRICPPYITCSGGRDAHATERSYSDVANKYVHIRMYTIHPVAFWAQGLLAYVVASQQPNNSPTTIFVARGGSRGECLWYCHDRSPTTMFVARGSSRGSASGTALTAPPLKELFATIGHHCVGRPARESAAGLKLASAQILRPIEGAITSG